MASIYNGQHSTSLDIGKIKITCRVDTALCLGGTTPRTIAQ